MQLESKVRPKMFRFIEIMVYGNETKIYNSNRNLIMRENKKNKINRPDSLLTGLRWETTF